ncbi:MAG: DUF4249 family protein, partial [Salinibacter sp.]
MNRSILVPLLIALGLFGCDTTVQPPIPAPPEGLAVYSAVRAFDSTHYALVSRPRAADERPIQYVQDATVRIGGQALSVVPEDSINRYGYRPLTPPGQRSANYVADSLPIRPGKTYRLRVTTEEHTVTGKVCVPGAFTGVVDSMTVRWHPSQGAQLYKVRVRRYAEYDVAWEFVTTTRDTSATIVPEAVRYNASFEPGPHEVIITAADSNLVRYRKATVRRAGIEGGFGFFGAITRIQGTVS